PYRAIPPTLRGNGPARRSLRPAPPAADPAPPPGPPAPPPAGGGPPRICRTGPSIATATPAFLPLPRGWAVEPVWRPRGSHASALCHQVLNAGSPAATATYR